MTTRWYFAMILGLVAAGSAAAQTPADEESIRTQLVSYGEARQSGNGPAQARFYAVDADSFLTATRKVTRGRAEIEKELSLPPDPNRKFRIEVESVNFLSPDIALADAQYFVAAPEPAGHAFYVMVKRDGEWLIRSVRTQIYPRPARTP